MDKLTTMRNVRIYWEDRQGEHVIVGDIGMIVKRLQEIETENREDIEDE